MDETWMSSTPSPTQIDDLPNELLVQILGQRSLEDDLWSVQLVCKRWRAVITQSIGFAIQVMTAIFDRIDWPAASVKSFNAIKDFPLRSLFVNWGKSAEEEMMMSSLKYPHLLNHLFLDGYIKPEIFTSLLNGVINLEVLELNLWGLYLVKPHDLKTLLLPKLRVLCVQESRYYKDGDGKTLSLPNFKRLLKGGTFPSLAELIMEVPFEKASDLDALLNFFERHPHLAKIHVYLSHSLTCEDCACSTPGNPEDLCPLVPRLEKLKTCALQDLKIADYIVKPACPQVIFWKQFLTQQANLKSLDLTLTISFIAREFLEDIFAKNKSSLESISLFKPRPNGFDRELELECIFDCRILANIARLQTLKVRICDQFINLTGLPKTLETIELTGAIKTEKIEHIMLNMPNLKFISLSDVCNKKEGYGVSTNLLQKFIAKGTVRWLELKGCCCIEPLPPEGLLDGGRYEQAIFRYPYRRPVVTFTLKPTLCLACQSVIAR